MSASRLPLNGAFKLQGSVCKRRIIDSRATSHTLGSTSNACLDAAEASPSAAAAERAVHLQIKHVRRTIVLPVPQVGCQVRHVGEHTFECSAIIFLWQGSAVPSTTKSHVGAGTHGLCHVLEVVEIRAGVGRLRLGAHHGYDLC